MKCQKVVVKVHPNICPSPRCRCGGLWAALSGAPGCRHVTPTSREGGRRSGCSVMFSMPSRWDVSWRTSCSWRGRSACLFTGGETSSACRAEVSWKHTLRFTLYVMMISQHPVVLWYFNVTWWKSNVYMHISILVFNCNLRNLVILLRISSLSMISFLHWPSYVRTQFEEKLNKPFSGFLILIVDLFFFYFSPAAFSCKKQLYTQIYS